MKKIIKLFLSIILIFSSYSTFAVYNEEWDSNPVFMEQVYNFINTEDITTSSNLDYCEQVYLEATRRREYTIYENNRCWVYFEMKNNEEIAYMKYMLNNRELFY